MSLAPWNPYRKLDNFNSEIDSFFENSLKLFGGISSPRVDVYQTDKNIIVKAEIPGVTKEDLNLYIDDNLIRLSGETKRENEFKDENAYTSERYFGSFSRTIPLPFDVKSEDAKADYKDGILTITVPKKEFSNSKVKKIKIQ